MFFEGSTWSSNGGITIKIPGNPYDFTLSLDKYGSCRDFHRPFWQWKTSRSVVPDQKGTGFKLKKIAMPEKVNCHKCSGRKAFKRNKNHELCCFKCPFCHGAGTVERVMKEVKIAEDWFDFYSLQKISTLPNVVIYKAGDSEGEGYSVAPAYFTFTGGEGWIMTTLDPTVWGPYGKSSMGEFAPIPESKSEPVDVGGCTTCKGAIRQVSER